VLDVQQRLRERLERQPVRFLARELEGLLDETRAELAAFLDVDAAELVFVANATTGVNTVLRSLDLAPGDELVVTDHAYLACRNALDFVASAAGARVVVARIPFPIAAAAQATEAVARAVTDRTRLALIDHVTSPTGLVLPLDEIVRVLTGRGVEVLVDGAHAPGMVDLDVDALGADYYTGNCHKWLCAPKGAAFLWVRREHHERVRPLVISHGASFRRPGRSRLHQEFDWTGTDDPTAVLSVPAALRFMGELWPGGWSELRARNRELALLARRLLCDALGIPAPSPDAMIGSLAAVPLPPGSDEPPRSPLYTDPLQDTLMERWRIEVPIIPWPAPPQRLLRVAAQAYNGLDQYRTLARALAELLGAPSGPSRP
jgi:isopenicillin-N epimerase